MTSSPRHTAELDGQPLLSLVIPAYNERTRLPRTLRIVRKYLTRHHLSVEVIVVDDGSVDGTAEVAAWRARLWPALRLVRIPHGGKGRAVQAGILAARGEYTFICDADLSMPITELAKFLPERFQGAEIAIASREGSGAHRYGEPAHRHLMGRVFNAVVRALALPGIQDSQCGFKCLRSDVAQRLAQVQTIEGWGFDVELLYVARRWGYHIVEVPIEWYYAPSSRIHPLRDAWSMTRDVLTVRRNAHKGRYAAPLVQPGEASPSTAASLPTPVSVQIER